MTESKSLKSSRVFGFARIRFRFCQIMSDYDDISFVRFRILIFVFRVATSVSVSGVVSVRRLLLGQFLILGIGSDRLLGTGHSGSRLLETRLLEARLFGTRLVGTRLIGICHFGIGLHGTRFFRMFRVL